MQLVGGTELHWGDYLLVFDLLLHGATDSTRARHAVTAYWSQQWAPVP